MSVQPVVPCLWFEREAEIAAAYYVSLIPESAIVKVSRAMDGRRTA